MQTVADKMEKRIARSMAMGRTREESVRLIEAADKSEAAWYAKHGNARKVWG